MWMRNIIDFAVIRSWRNNVQLKVTQPNQLEIYQTLCIMESKLNEEVFKQMMDLFMQQWDKKEPGFIKKTILIDVVRNSTIYPEQNAHIHT